MKKKNSQAKAYLFPKRLTKKTARQSRLDAEVKTGKISLREYFRRSLIESSKPAKRGMGEFLCNHASLQNVAKEAEAMTLDDSENDANREEALHVKLGIENAQAAKTTGHAAQVAFIAGLRWMQIFWAKSLDGKGRPITGLWKTAEQIFKANPEITAGQLWIKLRKPGMFQDFKRTLTRKRKIWNK